MHKYADLIFGTPVGSGYIWPQEMHETLILAIYFPYFNRFPWELRKNFLFLDVGRHMWGVLKEDNSLGGYLLSQLCRQTRRIYALPFSKLRKLLSRGPSSCASSE